MKLEQATELANEVKALLTPYCTRIEVAGSVRRKKQLPIKDIEIVCIPKFEDITIPSKTLFANETTIEKKNALHNFFTNYFRLRDRKWAVFDYGDPSSNGAKSPFSEKYYRIKYKDQKLDVFVVIPPAQWGVIYTIRTGDEDFSHWLVQQGWKDNIVFQNGKMVIDITTPRNPTAVSMTSHSTTTIHTPEETDVFKVLGLPWVEPEKRTQEWINWYENTQRLKKDLGSTLH